MAESRKRRLNSTPEQRVKFGERESVDVTTIKTNLVSFPAHSVWPAVIMKTCSLERTPLAGTTQTWDEIMIGWMQYYHPAEEGRIARGLAGCRACCEVGRD